MKLIETYAASSGLQISKPFIYTKYFPTPWDSYILLHAGGGMNSKRYDYFNEVVDILKAALPSLTIVQIGGHDDPPVPGTVDMRGKTTIHQTAYLIKNAKLLIGNDSCNVHIASGFDTPIVALYGPTTTYNHGPCFSTPEKVRLITADLQGNKPTYSKEEYPKTINRIKPEEVASNALELLGIQNSKLRKSLYFGNQYLTATLDIVPDSVLSAQFLPEALATIRMDYLFDEQKLAENLSIRKYNVVTNKPININLLKHFKGNIVHFVYDVETDYNVEFVESLRRAGINFILTSFLKDEELAKAKLDLFDYNIIIQRDKIGAKFLKEHPEINADCKYKTNKFLLSGGKFYLSKLRWQQGKPTESINHKTDSVEISEDFFDFADNYYIYQE